MQDVLLCLLVISPLLFTAAIALERSQSLLSLLLVLLGAIVMAILTVLSGIFWLQTCHRQWMESQAAGFLFVPVIVPIYAYIGAIAGLSLVAILAGPGSPGEIPGVSFLASGITVVLSGVIPAAIVAFPARPSSGEGEGNLVGLVALAIGVGGMSAWIASAGAVWLVTVLFQSEA